MDIIAIDPGPTESGWVIIDTAQRRIVDHGIAPNNGLCAALAKPHRPGHLVVEMIASYGMPVGESIFETCVWIGHFISAFTDNRPDAINYTRITRNNVKLTLCKRSGGVNSSIVRQRCIDLWGKPGTKKKPGATYGITSHAWQALAVGTTWMLQRRTPGTDAWQG